MLKILVAVVVAVVMTIAPANAEPSGGHCPPDDPECYVFDDLPAGPPGGGTGGRGGGTGGRAACTLDGKTVPCQLDGLGSYVGGGCYVRQVAAPVPDPHAGAGGWYVRTCNVFSGNPSQSDAEWSLNPPTGGPSPEELAREALAKIRLLGAAVGTAPGPDGAGLVGLPVWLWTAVTPNTWGPITSSASSGGLTVTITGRATRIVWSMGDGSTVTCHNPGTPYDAGYADQPSPNCGHVYQKASRSRPSGVYRISAVTHWRVDWAGGGQSGVIDTTRQSSTTLAIDELQVVTS
ncbi:hypothetical protein GCM10009557_02960 [Virgisporangium ochraceum]|uniref:ATP/GTP-binding protein n=1 Tax=Virgisporangium ochraceum TaxID=65505 RepID=A0A8J4EAW0_9ACTN|nr:hypothetical protein [Virgisporangium ochraceum]GIJ67959.1 hypothetical protein Voc01_028760 [Virgisporangium ochraceum]